MGTMWRPALRCDSSYRDYIDSLYKVTALDKNQIMRLMWFVAAHSEDFKIIISEYKKAGVNQLPLAPWHSWEDVLWLKQTYKKKSDGTTQEKIDSKEVSIQKGDGGVIKIEVSSLL